MLSMRPAARLRGLHRRLSPQARDRVNEHADWLFKVIGAANGVLGDPAARRKYDLELLAQAGRAPTYSPRCCSLAFVTTAQRLLPR